ncbi:hypothetical protein ACFFGR_06650 [Arthrobacter liuii]|uniref:DUF4430 domain-containing protein n=1 Tax=Arthrobacter liuii TaxID=1476996 RepID=A0ABQ2AMU7_9MICC|nr:hypothetical protein [Arthrobacter liuii]GGH92721.1 hypothetical protein GCM10007170_11920 [Arthrobacter liuii]
MNKTTASKKKFLANSAVTGKRLGVLLAVSALVAGTAACSGPSPAPSVPSGGTSAASSPTATASVPATPAAPAATGWSLDPAGGNARIKAAGLDVLNAEGTADHYHAHLDVLVDGKAVPVPAYIGFSFSAAGQPNGISALHTHDTSGIIHVEAPTAGLAYTLGQVLTEWGVMDGQDATGTPHGGTGGWSAYVNGVRQDGPITGVVLKAHDEVVLSYGAAPSPVPATYSFPAGL